MSTTPIFAYLAGTKQPICAIRTIIAVCRMNVDLPDIFGPVIIMSLLSFMSSRASFGVNGLSPSIFSITGCLPSLMSITLSRVISGLT